MSQLDALLINDCCGGDWQRRSLRKTTVEAAARPDEAVPSRKWRRQQPRLRPLWQRRRRRPFSYACRSAWSSCPHGWTPFRRHHRRKASRRCGGTCAVEGPSCDWTASDRPRTCTACLPRVWPGAPEGGWCNGGHKMPSFLQCFNVLTWYRTSTGNLFPHWLHLNWKERNSHLLQRRY